MYHTAVYSVRKGGLTVCRLDLFTQGKIDVIEAVLMLDTMFGAGDATEVDIEHIPVKIDGNQVIATEFTDTVNVVSWAEGDLDAVRRYRSRRLGIEFLYSFLYSTKYIKYIDRGAWKWLREKCRMIDMYSFKPIESAHVRGVLRRRGDIVRLAREKYGRLHYVLDPMGMEKMIIASKFRDLDVLLNMLPNESYTVKDGCVEVYGIERFEVSHVFRR
jgi:hypothetical protein